MADKKKPKKVKEKELPKEKVSKADEVKEKEKKKSNKEGHYCIYCGYYVKPGEYHHH